MRCFHTQGRHERNKNGNREPKVSAWQKRRKGEQEIFGCLNIPNTGKVSEAEGLSAFLACVGTDTGAGGCRAVLLSSVQRTAGGITAAAHPFMLCFCVKVCKAGSFLA